MPAKLAKKGCYLQKHLEDIICMEEGMKILVYDHVH